MSERTYLSELERRHIANTLAELEKTPPTNASDVKRFRDENGTTYLFAVRLRQDLTEDLNEFGAELDALQDALQGAAAAAEPTGPAVGKVQQNLRWYFVLLTRR